MRSASNSEEKNRQFDKLLGHEDSYLFMLAFFAPSFDSHPNDDDEEKNTHFNA